MIEWTYVNDNLPGFGKEILVGIVPEEMKKEDKNILPIKEGVFVEVDGNDFFLIKENEKTYKKAEICSFSNDKTDCGTVMAWTLKPKFNYQSIIERQAETSEILPIDSSKADATLPEDEIIEPVEISLEDYYNDDEEFCDVDNEDELVCDEEDDLDQGFCECLSSEEEYFASLANSMYY